ncbi:MAG TPA: ABC transporter permease [Caldisericia bacterium]|nr:ABC transporter permease [Caldisericia bacterium]HOC79382.1 ABC transporter permease [Caldisericia bacterium]HOG70809.1 ABC transporter permease [Caldisericia bacterium]HPA66031.1 ABC transporter permease [Caldisericia bacterium]HPM44917.1 ABC transporter permease [Caldisericia bacterium]
MATKNKKKKVTVIDNPNEQEVLSSSEYSYIGMVWSRFKRHKLATIGLVLLVFMALFAILAPVFELITGYPVEHSSLAVKMSPFSTPGIVAKIIHPDFGNPEKPMGRVDFWFEVTSDNNPEKTGFASVKESIFKNPEYRKFYDFNMKAYGNTNVLLTNDQVVEKPDGSAEIVKGGYSEFFIERARNKKSMLSGQIITYSPTFESVDNSITEVPGGYNGPREIDISEAPMNVFGTDGLGHDVLVRLSYGARMTLMIAFVVVILETLLGIFLGALAGFYGGFIDALIMRILELMMTVPTLPIYMVLSRFMGGGSAIGIIIILAAFGWTGVARMTRGMFLSLRNQEFTEAARAIGASPMRIMFKHLLPNSLAPIIVGITFSIGGVILTESTLSFLGLGVNKILTPTWGGMLDEANKYILDQPWPAVFSGFLIFLTVLAVNFIGDGLRDALDPRLKV